MYWNLFDIFSVLTFSLLIMSCVGHTGILIYNSFIANPYPFVEIQRDTKLPSVALAEFQTLLCRKMIAVKLLQEIQSIKENIKLKKSEKEEQQGLAQHKLLREVLWLLT